MTNQLLEVKQVPTDIETFLQSIGQIFKVFNLQDSGCVSYGVEIAGQKWFVKYSDVPQAIEYLKNAIAFNTAVQSKYLPRIRNHFNTPTGLALVYEWVGGEVLATPEFKGPEGRKNPASPFYRFAQLPVEKIIKMLNTAYETHVEIEQAGYVAVDFYDGCIIYDFATDDVHFCDFDHYVQGAFVLETDRLPGSGRFMAPEESIKGSRIDHLTNVFTMGAAAFVFLGGATDRSIEKWRASEALHKVALKAVSPKREERYQSVREFYEAWKGAVKS